MSSLLRAQKAGREGICSLTRALSPLLLTVPMEWLLVVVRALSRALGKGGEKEQWLLVPITYQTLGGRQGRAKA